MKKIKIFTAIITLSMLMIIYSACTKSSSSYGGGSTGGTGGTVANTISIRYTAFSPDSYTVKVGTIVTWKNNDGVAHSATSDDGSSFDLVMTAGTSKSYTFSTVGTFSYHCKYHSGMTATIIVTP